MSLIERIEGELLDAMHTRAVANAEQRTDAPTVRDMAVKAAALAEDHYRGAVDRIRALKRTQDPYDPDAITARNIAVWNEAIEAAITALGGQ